MPLVIVVGGPMAARVELEELLSGRALVVSMGSAQGLRALVGQEGVDAVPDSPLPQSRECVLAWQLRWQERELRFDDQVVRLTPLEFAVLAALERARGEVVDYRCLCEQGWGTPHLGDGAHLHATVKRLRRKLAQAGAPVRIEAVRGLGMRLTRRV